MASLEDGKSSASNERPEKKGWDGPSQHAVDGILGHEGSKYLRTIHSTITPSNYVEADVYSVLVAFDVTCPATAHAVKKLLAAGERGKGSRVDDLVGAKAAISRAIEFANAEAMKSE